MNVVNIVILAVIGYYDIVAYVGGVILQASDLFWSGSCKRGQQSCEEIIINGSQLHYPLFSLCLCTCMQNPACYAG